MSRISFLQDMLTSLFDRRLEGGSELDDRSFQELCQALLSSRGELSGHRIALALLDQFDHSDLESRQHWFRLLLDDYDIDTTLAVSAARAYAERQSAQNWRQLSEATLSKRFELLQRINRVPGATGRLVGMRESLLELLPENEDLARVDSDFEQLFHRWFNQGFLVLRQIDWDTPASILEKIIRYEAVHAINDWSELRSRLQPDDRRCFAFFHPAMPDDPLIFVEVALTRSLPESIQSVLSTERDALAATEADTAVFYSISNCQTGLRGVSFGNFLIKQVAKELAGQLGNIKTFRTLSPVPSLAQWIRKRDQSLCSARLNELAEQALRRIDRPTGIPDAEDQTAEDSESMRVLVAHYLVNTRRQSGEPNDPVARFHLGNGASLSSVLANADNSPRGASQSGGVMVSYLYDLNVVESNHEAYAQERTVATSKEVENLLRSLPDTDVLMKTANG